VRFLVDRCAGHTLADWLRGQRHDVIESRDRGDDPGDLIILQWAASEQRVLITIDKDFGELVFKEAKPHCGLVRLPDVPAEKRIELMTRVIREHEEALSSGALITVRGGRVRVSRESR